MVVETNNGPIELTEKAFALNLEIFEIKENIRRLAARIVAANDFEKIEEAADALAENIQCVRDLERQLDAENAE